MRGMLRRNTYVCSVRVCFGVCHPLTHFEKAKALCGYARLAAGGGCTVRLDKYWYMLVRTCMRSVVVETCLFCRLISYYTTTQFE